MANALYLHPDLGTIFTPRGARDLVSYPGQAVKRRHAPGEIGVFVAVHKRPVFDEEPGTGRLVLRRMQMLMHSITTNERLDKGAIQQAKQVFGGGSTPAAPSATIYPKVIAVATTGFTTKTKTDSSIGVITIDVTTNEFTTIGLSRAAADTPVGGDYTAPSTLGGQFTQRLKKTFTASGSGTAHGAAAYDSTTVVGSILYVEDIFSSDAILVNLDTLLVNIDVLN